MVLETAEVLGCVVDDERTAWPSDTTGLEASAHPAKSRQAASTPEIVRLSSGGKEDMKSLV